MDKKKIIISLIGIAALVVPVILLIVFTGRPTKQPSVASGERSIDPKTVEDVVGKIVPPAPIVVATPTPATPSAQPKVELEGSSSAQ